MNERGLFSLALTKGDITGKNNAYHIIQNKMCYSYCKFIHFPLKAYKENANKTLSPQMF